MIKEEKGGGGVIGSPGASSGFSIVVAMDKHRGIGQDGGLPWPKLKGDMKFFRELTTCPDRSAVEKRWGLRAEESAAEHSWDEVNAMLKFAHKLPEASDTLRNAVIMGRKTWESLPEKFRPLPDRFNGVLSAMTILKRQARLGDRTWPFFDNALAYLRLGIHSTDPIHDLPSNRPETVGEIFVIGGGKVYAETVLQPDCDHLYITEIDSEFPCDTFFPETSEYTPMLSSPWIVEDGIRYRFRRFDRVS